MKESERIYSFHENENPQKRGKKVQCTQKKFQDCKELVCMIAKGVFFFFDKRLQRVFQMHCRV